MNERDYGLRELSKEDKEIIYKWRNLEHIRVNMYNNQIIPYKDHCRWMENVLNVQREYYRIFIYHDTPLGLISFKRCTEQHLTCSWGFYIGESHAPKGAGTKMGYLGLDYAFHRLGMNKVVGEVLPFNNKSDGFHRKLGFKLESLLENNLNREGQLINAKSFSILKQEWEKHKRTLNLNL